MSKKNFFIYDDEISCFWLMNYDIYNNPICSILSVPLLRCNKISCPGYLPYVKYGLCRVCNHSSKDHRKYYIYF